MKCLECGKKLWFWQKQEYYADFSELYESGLKKGYSWMNVHKDCFNKLIKRLKNKQMLNMSEKLFLEHQNECGGFK